MYSVRREDIIGETFYYAGEAHAAREQNGASVVGLNCLRGPETMTPWLDRIRAALFAERMKNHFMYGTHDRLPEHIAALGDTA